MGDNILGYSTPRIHNSEHVFTIPTSEFLPLLQLFPLAAVFSHNIIRHLTILAHNATLLHWAII